MVMLEDPVKVVAVGRWVAIVFVAAGFIAFLYGLVIWNRGCGTA